MAKKPTKGASIEALILDPASSVALTLSDAWHYSFDTEKATDAERAWIGPFETREDVDAAMVKDIEAAAAKAGAILLGVKI
ncbi:hypothetical protein NKH72_21955 [Mesorhizobium sp. M0955]|uniref:hypothetical protein n=1 Tax=Mesorhizobium sp. M0955 TaxID=2957033 RepID=UPI00333D0818